MIDLMKKPILFDDVIFRAEAEMHYLHQQSENKILVLENPTAIRIIECCDGKNRIMDIIEILNESYYNVPRENIESDVTEMIEHLGKERLIKLLE